MILRPNGTDTHRTTIQTIIKRGALPPSFFLRRPIMVPMAGISELSSDQKIFLEKCATQPRRSFSLNSTGRLRRRRPEFPIGTPIWQNSPTSSSRSYGPGFSRNHDPGGSGRAAHMRPDLVKSNPRWGPIGKKYILPLYILYHKFSKKSNSRSVKNPSHFYYNIFFYKNQTDRMTGQKIVFFKLYQKFFLKSSNAMRKIFLTFLKKYSIIYM